MERGREGEIERDGETGRWGDGERERGRESRETGRQRERERERERGERERKREVIQEILKSLHWFPLRHCYSTCSC